MEQRYRIDMDEEDLKRYSGSKHVGMPDERRDFVGLKVFMAVEKETDYGVVTMLGFEDVDGNVLIWFATGRRTYAKGDVVDLKATVKGYDESDGVRKTVITRAVKPEKKTEWRACAIATARGRRQ